MIVGNSPLELELVPACAIEVECPALGLGDLSSASSSPANGLTFSTKAE